jgi:zinc and cadmium transporter
MTLAILFSLLGSVGAMAGAALLLTFPDAMRQRLLPCLLSYAAILAQSPEKVKISKC